MQGLHKGENVAIKKVDLEKVPDAKIDEIRVNNINFLRTNNFIYHTI